MVYSADRIPRAEALAAQNILDTLISYNLKQEYLEMCGFVRASISIDIMISNSLIIRGPWDKDALIQQRPELTDGTVIELIAPWQG